MSTQVQDTDQFGVHIMIDGYGAVAARLHDKVVLAGLLDDLPGEMGMHRICPAVVVEVGPGCKKDPGGLSGFVMIAESHISIHTFPARGFVTMDLYTCQCGVDRAAVIARLMSAFDLTDADIHVQNRGLRYPASDGPDTGRRGRMVPTVPAEVSAVPAPAGMGFPGRSAVA